MILHSQNGWQANDQRLTESRTVPGTSVRISVRKGAAGDLLMYVASRFDKEVEDIDNARGGLDDWGYAERPVRGGTDLSNHASGTAIDLNATQHPLGTQPSANYTQAQINKIREICDATEDAVRWGGDYVGRKDPMHFEINASSAVVARVAAKLAGQKSTVPGALEKGMAGPSVTMLQRVLNAWYPSLPKLEEDGVFGPATEERVRYAQARAGLVSDGVVGPLTKALLHL